ncbi:MAG: OB-fold domain-containing protein [Candidatus Nanopelagicales bacterium]|nr:OB-fold domain-containing protein [Candidatus Nanopelagicales bacterium]MDZ4249963.1 OB-fold domain-containing protein [Candidatus Nanopelagicales bacterium]
MTGDLVTVPLTMDITWRYAASEPMARFLGGLRERRIEALACDACGRRYLPPRPFCGRCYMRMSRWVPVADTGQLVAWTVLHIPVLDSRTGEARPVPCGMGLIRLDGADTTLNHFVTIADELALGTRLRAVWRDELVGAMHDISHFEVIG